MRKFLYMLPVAVATLGASSAFATDPPGVESEITAALAAGATTAGTLLVAAVAIPLAFLVFKIGKRVIGKA